MSMQLYTGTPGNLLPAGGLSLSDPEIVVTSTACPLSPFPSDDEHLAGFARRT